MNPVPSTPILFDWQRRHVRVADARVLPERRRREEEKDQLPAHVGHRHLAEQPRLRGESLRAIAAIPTAHRIDRGERRRIVSARLRRASPRAPGGTPPTRPSGLSSSMHVPERRAPRARARARSCRRRASPRGRTATSRRIDRMHELVHEPDLQRLLRAHVLARAESCRATAAARRAAAAAACRLRPESAPAAPREAPSTVFG